MEKYQSCSLSASNSLLEAFNQRKKYNMTLDLGAKTMAIYTIYKRTTGMYIRDGVETKLFLPRSFST